MDSERFAKIKQVYWDSFGPSGLEAFLDEHPPKTGWLLWHFKRRFAQFFAFFFYPAFIVIEVWGVIGRTSHNLLSLSFDVALFCHNVQNCTKMILFLTRLPTVRALCLDFSQFHIAKHRPALTSWMLEKDAQAASKLNRKSYMISYANLLFWFIVPVTASIGKYLLYLIGWMEPQATYIPRLSPSRFPFDMSIPFNRVLTAICEYPIFSAAFAYFQPIDMFFATTINMAQAQFRVLNSALFTMPSELETFLDMGALPEDTPERMSMRLFIEDHQAMIRYGSRLREFLNPVVGLVTFHCITVICNMSITATAQFKSDAPFLESVVPSIGSVLVVLTSSLVFFTFTSMTGTLKDAEESVFHSLFATDWYTRDAKYRKDLIIMQKQSMTARKIRMFSVGDMDRSTFIDGLRMIYSYYNFMQRFK